MSAFWVIAFSKGYMVKQTKKEQDKHRKAHHEDDMTAEELAEGMEAGERDEDLDISLGREKQVEEDEVEPWEAGFAEGASEEGQLAKDALTGEPLLKTKKVVELKIKGKVYRFANDKNAQKFKEKKK